MPRRSREQAQRRLGLKSRLRSESRKSPFRRIKPRQRPLVSRKRRKKPKALRTRRSLPLQNKEKRLKKRTKKLWRLPTRRRNPSQRAIVQTRRQCLRRNTLESIEIDEGA